MKEKAGRIAKWDNLKFLLILCVVIGHFFSRYVAQFDDDNSYAKSLIFFIYSFHMPAFVFISGLFAKRTINEKRYDKVFSYLMMYVVTKYALLFVRAFYEKKIEFRYFTMNDVSWYAFAIFAFCLMTIFLKQFDARYVLILSVVVSCATGYASEVGTFLSLSRIATFYPFFLMGYYLQPDAVLKITEKKSVKLISAVILILTAYISYRKIDKIYWLLKILKGKTPYDSLAHYAEYGALLRLCWYIAAMILVFALISIVPSVHSIFTKWGSRTLQVYALHYSLMLAFFHCFNGMKWVDRVWPNHRLLVLLIISVIVTCVLSIKPIYIFMNAIIFPKKKVSK